MSSLLISKGLFFNKNEEAPSMSAWLPKTNAAELHLRTRAPRRTDRLRFGKSHPSRPLQVSNRRSSDIRLSRNRKRHYEQPVMNFVNEYQHYNIPRNNNVTFPKKSQLYSPKESSESSGFVPVPGPYGKKERLRRQPVFRDSAPPGRLSGRESNLKERILGNGHFEILKGGIFSDTDENEIEDNRRMGRGFRSRNFSPFPQSLLRFSQNVRFPTGRNNGLFNPVFNPFIAFSEKQESFL